MAWRILAGNFQSTENSADFYEAPADMEDDLEIMHSALYHHPTKSWDTLTNDEITAFIAESTTPGAARFCTTPMGFYFVSLLGDLILIDYLCS